MTLWPRPRMPLFSAALGGIVAVIAIVMGTVFIDAPNRVHILVALVAGLLLAVAFYTSDLNGPDA